MASRQRLVVSKAYKGFIEKAMRRLTIRVYQNVTVATPVRFGFARAGWVPSTGGPQPGPTTPPSTAVEALAANLFAKNRQLATALSKGYRLTKGPVFIVNAVRYIVPLNRGSSAQAPAMFVESSIVNAVAVTTRELRSSGG